jgi:hypothetical protein
MALRCVSFGSVAAWNPFDQAWAGSTGRLTPNTPTGLTVLTSAGLWAMRRKTPPTLASGGMWRPIATTRCFDTTSDPLLSSSSTPNLDESALASKRFELPPKSEMISCQDTSLQPRSRARRERRAMRIYCETEHRLEALVPELVPRQHEQ